MNKVFSLLGHILNSKLANTLNLKSNLPKKFSYFAFGKILSFLQYYNLPLSGFIPENRDYLDQFDMSDNQDIPVIYGLCKVDGKVVWVSDNGQKIIGTENKRYVETFVNLAIVICEGEILSLERMWVNGRPFSKKSISMNIYYGNQDQKADPLILLKEGEYTAFKGLAYVVIENFPLSEFFGNIPKFSFEVERVLDKFHNVRAISLYSGLGKDVYNTGIQFEVEGFDNQGSWVPSNLASSTNGQASEFSSNIIVSINRLINMFPDIKKISVFITWFASDLDITKCRILPAVEYQNTADSFPDRWVVNNITRDNAILVARFSNGEPVYGESASDVSVLKLLEHLKSLNLEIYLHTNIVLNSVTKQSFGKNLIVDPEYLSDFFFKEGGYNDFVLHYANLTKGLINGFIIGPSMSKITSAKLDGDYIGVDLLIDLTSLLREILGDKVAITYSSDWIEYHSHEGRYNMDKLWSSKNIDFIGINAYFPITDDNVKINFLSKDFLIKGWTSGEGYEYHYNADRSEKYYYKDQRFAWKDLEFWWSNFHYEENDQISEWQPRSKKILFTEFGFPSIDCSTNSPGLTNDIKSVDYSLPPFSNSSIDFKIQRIAIEATLEKWRESDMIEDMFLHYWSPIPYPCLYDLQKLWADSYLWPHNCCVNGKLDTSLISSVIGDLLSKIDNNIHSDTSSICDTTCGLVVQNFSVKHIIDSLCMCYSLMFFEKDGRILFHNKGSAYSKIVDIDGNDILKVSENAISTNIIQNKNKSLYFCYISRIFDYEYQQISNFAKQGNGSSSVSIKTPIIIDEWQSKNIIFNLQNTVFNNRRLLSFFLPLKYLHLRLNDIIHFKFFKKDYFCKINFIKYGKNLFLECSEEVFLNDGFLFAGNRYLLYNFSNPLNNKLISYHNRPSFQSINYDIQVLELPSLPYEKEANVKIFPKIFGNHFLDIMIDISYDEGKTFDFFAKIDSKPTIGTVINKLSDTESDQIIHTQEIVVVLYSGDSPLNEEDRNIGDKGIALIGNEIIYFQYAKKISDSKYIITNILRGQHGTNTNMKNHRYNETFLILNNRIQCFNYPISKIGFECLFRFRTSVNAPLEDCGFYSVVRHRFSGIFFKPMPVCALRASQRGNLLNISWAGRVRQSGGLRDSVDVIFDDDFDGYFLNIQQYGKSVFHIFINKNTISIDLNLIKGIEIGIVDICVNQVSSIFGHGEVKSISAIISDFKFNECKGAIDGQTNPICIEKISF